MTSGREGDLDELEGQNFKMAMMTRDSMRPRVEAGRAKETDWAQWHMESGEPWTGVREQEEAEVGSGEDARPFGNGKMQMDAECRTQTATTHSLTHSLHCRSSNE